MTSLPSHGLAGGVTRAATIASPICSTGAASSETPAIRGKISIGHAQVLFRGRFWLSDAYREAQPAPVAALEAARPEIERVGHPPILPRDRVRKVDRQKGAVGQLLA
jgi:hypothetical protein